MRISDDRYRRDRRAFDLAWRLLGHSARTGTISRWTGLTERRVRTLQRSYRNENAEAFPKRPRGRSPYRIELLLRSPQQRHDAAELARMCLHAGVIPQRAIRNADQCLPGIERGELLCAVFEGFRERFPESPISLERAILVIFAVASREEVDFRCCATCARTVLADRLAPQDQHCDHCGGQLIDYAPAVRPGGAAPISKPETEPVSNRDSGDAARLHG